MQEGLQLFFLMAAQEPSLPAGGLPWLDDLARGGPYGVIAVLLVVCRFLFLRKEAQEEKAAKEIKDLTAAHNKDIKELNDKILQLTQNVVGSVTQNIEVQRQLIEAVKAGEAK